MLKPKERWEGKPLHAGPPFIKRFVSKHTTHSFIKYRTKINEFLQPLSSISLKLMYTSQDNIHSFLSLPCKPLHTHILPYIYVLAGNCRVAYFHQHLKYEYLYI